MKDDDKNINQIKLLQEYIAQLEEENNLLANRAEEIILLNLLSNAISTIDDEEKLIDELLEKISILLNLSLCCCYAKSIDGYRLISDYYIGENNEEKTYTLILNECIEEKLKTQQFYNNLLSECVFDSSWKFPVQITQDTQILIVSFESQWIKNGIFIFLSDNKELLQDNVILIQQGIRIILDKIDKLSYLKKIEYLNQNLEYKVEQRTKELSDINEKLIEEINVRHAVELKLREAVDKAQESDKLKSAFLANMSHEIRTPMNAIVGFSEILSSSKCSDKEINDYTNLIYSNSLSLLTLINDLLDFSKIEANQLTIKKKQCNLNKIFADITILTQHIFKQYKKENITFSISNKGESKDSLIFTDELRLKQILLNLISNAIKFSLKGSIKLHYYNKGDKYYFEVSDEGIGIEKEQHDLIFNRFTRVISHVNKPIMGSGLGLTITRNLVEMLGGHISVDSKPGRGSVFMFFIDVSQNTSK
ncbi:sensor histidine kinase [Plebeiibacterium sediminum]|uniref:histidine kinase n=1 Tax=Plebeiibacterium sediminum TaxID=2992112 RepID=A0AAE3M634_9BACT|nr:ATP-binding protein [Plebeiobacterium sediminum]MCW3787822.1 ATP-binding protein [Plebeiobacterium sediminum]